MELELVFVAVEDLSIVMVRGQIFYDHFDTFGEIFDFDTFKNDTFENDTFESVWASSISFESNPDFEIRASNLKKSIFMIIDLSQD